jgi:hypothetical protein
VAVPVSGGNVLSVHSMVISGGHVMAGGVLSSTNINCVQTDVFVHASVAVHNLIMMNSWGQPPATVTSLKATVGIEQLSVADAVPVKGGSVLSVHSIVRFAGQTTTGGVLSSTKMI